VRFRFFGGDGGDTGAGDSLEGWGSQGKEQQLTQKPGGKTRGSKKDSFASFRMTVLNWLAVGNERLVSEGDLYKTVGLRREEPMASIRMPERQRLATR
jgi:hypothetical protein